MKKKILFYNGQLFMGGIERVAISYLEGFAKDNELEVTLLIKENDPQKNIFLKDVPKNIPINFIKTEEMIKRRNRVSQRKKNLFWRILYPLFLTYERIYMKSWLKKYFEKNNYDVVIDFDMSLGKYLDVVKGMKIGWQHYSLAPKKNNKRKAKRFEKRLEKYDKIVVICDEMKKEAIELFNVPKEKLYRLYNPFDIEKVKTQLRIEENKEELLNKDYLVAVSRLVKGKGREDLIDIYYNLKQRGIKEKLYIIGEGAQREELEKKIKKLDLEEDVLLLGQKKNPFIWMENAKIFVHTSYGEGLPTVFLESMISGTPVIAYDCPTGPKDILGNNMYGVLVKTGDKKSFENEIIKLLENSKRGEEYIRRFHKEKLNDFSIKTIVDDFKKMID